jgi:hypothetical protein
MVKYNALIDDLCSVGRSLVWSGLVIRPLLRVSCAGTTEGLRRWSAANGFWTITPGPCDGVIPYLVVISRWYGDTALGERILGRLRYIFCRNALSRFLIRFVTLCSRPFSRAV